MKYLPRKHCSAVTGLGLMAASLALGGCSSLGGAASMEVEVQVYKGPLSLTKEEQEASLRAMLAQGEHQAIGLQAVVQSDGLSKNDGIRDGLLQTLKEIEHALHAINTSLGNNSVSKNLKNELEVVDTYPPGGSPPIDAGTRREIVRLAEQLRSGATYWVAGNIARMPMAKEDRVLIADYAAYAGELANALKSRADALEKQAAGVDRTALPLSMQLGGSNRTALSSLFKWNDAVNERLRFERTAPEYFSDRVGMIEQIYDDEAWAHINTSYASGAGDVSMAFIKDDIGNWSLKRFENDPTKLLNAYKEVGKSALGLAATLASGGTSSAATAALKSGTAMAERAGATQKALEIADRVAFGGGATSGAPQGNPTLTRIHERTKAQLVALQTEMKAAQDKLPQQIKDASDAVDAQQKVVDGLNQNVTDARKNAPGKTVAQWNDEAARKRGEASAYKADKDGLDARIGEIDTALAALPADRTDDQKATEQALRSERAAKVTERAQKASLEKSASDAATQADANAQALTSVDSDVQKINVKLTPAADKLAQLTKKRDDLIARRDGGLYNEMILRAKAAMTQHAAFVDEMEAVSGAGAASATAPAVAPGATLPVTPTVPALPTLPKVP